MVNEFIFELEKNGSGVIEKLKELMDQETQEEQFESAAVLRDRIQAIERLFHQRAMPTLVKKYYSKIEDVVEKNTKYMEIIDKIIANNGNKQK